MKKFLISFMAFTIFLAVGCGKKQTELEKAAKEMEKAGEVMSENMEEGMQNMADALKKMSEAANDGKSVEPVNFRDLKGLLPDDLPGLKRTEATGEKNSVMGIKVSTAEAQYDNDRGASVNVEITDMGTMKGFAGLAKAGWTMADIDKETDTGYERTTKIDGFKAYEKYETDQQWGEISVIVGDRFIVEISGSNVEMDVIKKAVEKIDLKKLEKMKDQGVSE